MISYKAITKYFESISEQHQQINSFTYGELNFFDKDKFTEYPALHITPTSTTIDDQVIVYGFDLIIFDRYNVESNKMINEASCLSDALLILQDICKEITDGKYFINADTLISMEMPVSVQPFIDTEPDNCSGWSTSINVITPNEASACLIPYFEPEQQFALNIVLPELTPTSHSWYSRFQIHKTSIIVLDEVKKLSPIVNTIAGANPLLSSGGNMTWSPQENAFKIINSSVTTPFKTFANIKSSPNGVFIVRVKDFGRYVTTASSLINSNHLFFIGDVGAVNSFLKIYLNSNGELVLENLIDSNIYTSPPIVPNVSQRDGVNTNSKTQHRRLESFTFAIQVEGSNVKFWYGLNETDYIAFTILFSIASNTFGLGCTRSGEVSDFYFQEMIYIEGNAMTDNAMQQTMTWLNYR